MCQFLVFLQLRSLIPAGSGVCVCPPGFTHISGTCQPKRTNDCTARKVSDRLGKWACPYGSYPGEHDIFYVDCTIEVVIQKFGTDGLCGTPYTDCLLKEVCGVYGSDECRFFWKETVLYKKVPPLGQNVCRKTPKTKQIPAGMTGIPGKIKTTCYLQSENVWL